MEKVFPVRGNYGNWNNLGGENYVGGIDEMRGPMRKGKRRGEGKL